MLEGFKIELCQTDGFKGCTWGMTIHANEAIVMRLTDGVMVRTRSIQRREREATMEMLNKLVDVSWDLIGVVRDQLMVGITMVIMPFRVRCYAKTDCQTDSKKYVHHK